MDLLWLDGTRELNVKMTRRRCFGQGAVVSDRNATIPSSEKISIYGGLLMRKMLKDRTVWMIAAAVAVAMLSVNLDQAQARPNFPRVFVKQYPGLKDQYKKVKCAVCHPKENNKKKKIRNIYGKALQEALGAKKVKDKKKIAAAMEKIEKLPSAIKGMSFGDLISEGKLPASTE